MKTILISAAAFFLFTGFACKKEKTVTVLRDCTGTYLQLEGKDYHVCNIEKVKAYQSGAVITATFKKLKKCKGPANEGVVCMMYHQNEGWIEVEKIKE